MELFFPGKHRGYTLQQYVLSLGQQALILPICALAWALGLLKDGPAVIYLLTGAYLTSDSLINYTPVSNCVTGEEGPPIFSWGVHAHHFFTVVLCAVGTILPPWPVREGAICILLGEVRFPREERRLSSKWHRTCSCGCVASPSQPTSLQRPRRTRHPPGNPKHRVRAHRSSRP